MTRCGSVGVSALPSDVLKAFGLPGNFTIKFGLRPFWGEAPNIKARRTEADSASAHRAAKPRVAAQFGEASVAHKCAV